MALGAKADDALPVERVGTETGATAEDVLAPTAATVLVMGAWGWPSLRRVTTPVGEEVIAPVTEVTPVATLGLEMPNCEVYWYAPVWSSMSWIP